MSTLEREIATYEALRLELAPRAGEFALITSDLLVGVFPTRVEALTAGYRGALPEPFLVREIGVEPRIREFTRDLTPECLP